MHVRSMTIFILFMCSPSTLFSARHTPIPLGVLHQSKNPRTFFVGAVVGIVTGCITTLMLIPSCSDFHKKLDVFNVEIPSENERRKFWI